jgi:hypothetical protein
MGIILTLAVALFATRRFWAGYVGPSTERAFWIMIGALVIVAVTINLREALGQGASPTAAVTGPADLPRD